MRKLTNSRLGRLLMVIITITAIYVWTRILVSRGGFGTTECLRTENGLGCVEFRRILSGSDWFMAYLFAIASPIMIIAMGFLLYSLIYWLVLGNSPLKPTAAIIPVIEDPCQDPKCPCARHIVEHERAAAAAHDDALATGRTVGFVISSND